MSGSSNYTDSKDKTNTSDSGRFISSYDNSAYYSDSGKFTRNNKDTEKTSEYGGTLPEGTSYGLVRKNFSEGIQDVKDVFASANYTLAALETTQSPNDGSTCNVAKDEGQLRYYYVTVNLDDNTPYTSSCKYVKYSNQIENGGFQDSGNSTQYDASLTTYWQTTNKGYTDNADKSNFAESYYRMHPLLEIATYTSSNAYGTYGNYYSYPGLSYDKEDIGTETADDSYLRLNYDDDSTTDYLFSANQFCEIKSTDNNTLYQTVMTVPDMPLYWSLTHHARTSSSVSTPITDSVVYKNADGEDVKVTNLGATSAKVDVSIDIMYVVIMNETDAESLLANGATLADQQTILNNMISNITADVAPQVKQTSEDGSSYLARYDCDSYTYGDGTEYSNISVWRVQTGSTKVELTFSSANAEAAAKAANNTDLFEYYAETYGTVKSYSYTSGSYSYATFYTEAKTYADTYDIPDGQYVSRYFFVAGTSSNSDNAYSTGGLSFGTYTDDAGNEQTITNYNEVTRATNGDSAGNFIDNVVFTQQLVVEVNYWVYDSNTGTYVLQSADTETSKAIQDNTVTAQKASDYYAKYDFVGSYISVEGGDADTPATEELVTATSFRADGDSALVMDLYYKPYEISIDKTINGLPENMSYQDFKDLLEITLYSLTDDGNGGYKKGDAVISGAYLKYAKDANEEESLSYSTGNTLEKGTYLLTETTHLLLTDSFDGWYSVDMSLANGMLQYDDSLGGYILVIGEDSDAAGEEDTDAVIEISLVNTYKPVAVQSTKSVLFGETDVDEINAGLGSNDPDDDTNLNYQSLTEYDNALRSVDDTDLTDDSKRLSVLSGDTLTYRMDLASTGRADSEDIVVIDTVPDGCTLQLDSIQILKQNRSKTTGNYYGVVQTVLTSSSSGTSWTITNDSVTFKITYDETNREITWEISEIDYFEQYYVEYAVTVDQIKASEERTLLTNTAQWTYLSKINSGATSDASTTVEVGMDMEDEETSEGSGEYTYTVTFSELSGYTVTKLRDALPDGFVIDPDTIAINSTAISATSYTITYYDADGDSLTETYSNDAIVSFTITSDEVKQNDDNKIILTFQGTQTKDKTVDAEIRNTAGITYTKVHETTSYTSIVAHGDAVTNQVETDVTHLYLEVEKELVESADDSTVDTDSTDTQQTFLFLVAYYAEGSDPDTDDPDSITYVTINCENGEGSSMLQTDKRGTYLVTEVTDWSNTDYDYVSAYLDGELAAGDSVTIDYTSGGTYLNSNGTFATTLGLVSEDHATATFCNTESLYAYRSGQAYARNEMTSKANNLVHQNKQRQ